MDTAGTSRGHKKSSNHVSVDVNVLAKSIEKEMDSLRLFSDECCCIYRVPKALRELNEKAYTPQIVSIGPYHHGKEEYRTMEGHKRHYLKEFLGWTKVELKVLIECIQKNEQRLRKCYAEYFKFNDIDFLKMMLVDAVFVISFVLAYNPRCSGVPEFFRLNNDSMMSDTSLIYHTRYDLCLLENQLPFFILDDLFKLCPISESNLGPMILFSCEFLYSLWSVWVPINDWNTFQSTEVKHFVDILRICQKPSPQNYPIWVVPLPIPSVTELHQAGIKFKMISMNIHCWKIHEMKFNINEGILEIPEWVIDDRTEILLGNIQAFEQCHKSVENYISNYSLFMNKLVRSTKDVEILLKKGIFNSDHDTVLNLFHNLGKESFYDRYFIFFGLVENLKKYSESSKNKWIAFLMQNYLHNPWKTISIIVGGMLLILTFMQTVCSIIQVA